ncbi:hypothetical protein [Paraburkholderia sp.]|uniref:hypothetical protein n=1 Tax=Paraburkholderia sp. TaxID=1926495 RepID=UPI0039E411FA
MMKDQFNGDNAKLVSAIAALLDLDAKGALVPHGVGGHARTMLEAAAVRLNSSQEAIYQAMANDEDHLENGPKDLWMDVNKKCFDEVSQREDFRTRIVYAAPLPREAATVPTEFVFPPMPPRCRDAR